MSGIIKDAEKDHWVYRAPTAWRPFLQLSRFDRPVGFWLLCLPGWIGLAFATISHGYAPTDLIWAVLILIGSVAMRGAGCTYNDIVDRDLDAQVERTALRPIPAGAVSVRAAWIWLFVQCGVGLIVLLCFPRLAQIVALCSVPLVAAYPFMKRITWWPQAWLGLTFNWAVLVAYTAKTGTLSTALIGLYFALGLWTIFYDTVYACQDKEDDALIGVKSTARLFGDKLIGRLSITALLASLLFIISAFQNIVIWGGISLLALSLHMMWQLKRLKQPDPNYLVIFKSNVGAAFLTITALLLEGAVRHFTAM